MILVQLLEAIVSTLADQVTTMREVAIHGGRFDLPEIKRAAARSPSARVCCLGMRNINFEGLVPKADAACVIFVVASDQAGVSRHISAMTMVAAIAALLPDNCWGLDGSVDGARGCRAENLFSKQVDENGIALWALSFSQQVDLSRASAADLDDFLRAYVDYDLAPTDGTIDASDQIDLPQE